VSGEPLPAISVIIPMRNEAGYIERCLETIFAQDYPAERIEIIVVDGDSDDGSAGILASFGERIRVLRNPQRIVPTAMNIGIRAARGEIVARVDAHTELAPDYLRRGVEALKRSGADNVGGPMVSVGGGAVGDAIALAMASRFGIGAYFHFAREDREVDTVYMGMWPRAVFERIGLFDEELVRNQDDELNYRLRKSGGRVFLSMSMRSQYQNRQSYRALMRQFYQYGLWKVRVLQKHPRQMSWRHFVPPLFVASVVICSVLSLLVPGVGWLAAAALVTYATALAVASGSVVRQHGWRHFHRVLLSFVIMHVAWGSGFLIGLVRFAPRWWRPEPPAPVLQATAR
jgi:glycosyltransferase involved in cell wall biosynthesis